MWLPAPQSIDAPALHKYEEKLNEAAKGDHAHSLAMQVLAACPVPLSCALVSLAPHKRFTQHGKQSVVARAAGVVGGTGGAAGRADLVLVPGELQQLCACCLLTTGE